MTPVQQQRFIGAALIVFVVIVLSYILLGQVKENRPEQTEEAPIVFDSVVDPILKNEDVEVVAEKGETLVDPETIDGEVLVDPHQAPAENLSELDLLGQQLVENTPGSTNTAPASPVEKASTATKPTPEKTVPSTPVKPAEKAVTPTPAKPVEKPVTPTPAKPAEKPVTPTPAKPAEKPVTPTPTKPAEKSVTPAPAKPAAAQQTKPAETTSTNSPRWVLQVISLSERQKADELSAKIKQMGYSPMIETANAGGKTVYRVRLQPSADRAQLEKAKSELDTALKVNTQIFTYQP